MKTLSDVGAAVRRLGFTIEILYGSGGYHIMLRDSITAQIHSGYSWDIEEAFEIAANRLQESREERMRQINSSPESTKH